MNIPIVEIRPFEIPSSKETHDEKEVFEDLEMTPDVDFDLDEATENLIQENKMTKDFLKKYPVKNVI